MRLGRLSIALLLPAALGVLTVISLTGAAAGVGDRPEDAMSMAFGNGEALARSAQRAAIRGEPPETIVLLSAAAVAASPLRYEPFFAASRAVNRPDLAEAVLYHAHVLTRRDRLMLESMADAAIRAGDTGGAVDILDEMFAQSTGQEPRFAMLADLIASPAARARVADVFDRRKSWRDRFLMQVDLTPAQADSMRSLIAEMRRGGRPLSDETLAQLVKRLSFSRPDHKIEGWRIWTTRADREPLGWPTGESAATTAYDWTIPDDLAGRVTFDGGALRYALDEADIVARMTTAFPVGRYRVAIAGADAAVRLRLVCNGLREEFGDGEAMAIDGDCPLQTLEVLAPEGKAKIDKIALTAQP